MRNAGPGYICAIFAVTLMAGQAHAASHFWCEDKEEQAAAGFSPPAAEVAAHRRFTLPAIHYKGRLELKSGFDFTLLVDAKGRAVCIDSYGRTEPKPDMRPDVTTTRERMNLLQGTIKWRYAPFLKAGVPSLALISEHVDEVIDPGAMPMPKGPLYTTSISLTRSGCMGSCPAYNVTLTGDGRVTYSSHDFTDVSGVQHYRISPGEVAALIERLRARDLWSMRPNYSAAMTDAASTTIQMTLGGKKKTVVDYLGRLAGMPEIVTTMQDDIDDTSGASDLVDLTARGLTLLDQNHFDFKGQAGADLLVNVLDRQRDGDSGPRVSDDTINALLDHNPPLIGGQTGSTPDAVRYPLQKIPALDQALIAGRETLIPRLIKRGALLTKGQPDQGLINSAFQSAITGGREAQVETMWAFHPGLIFQSPDDSGFDEKPQYTPSPVSLLLYRDSVTNDRWQDFAIAQFLIGKGCDINGKDARGHTLLMAAAQDDDPAFVQWLLDHGADIKALDKDGDSALTETFDEDTALVLLEAGADPTVEPQYGSSVFVEAQSNEAWPRVIDWLKQHGYDAQLKAAAPPAS